MNVILHHNPEIFQEKKTKKTKEIKKMKISKLKSSRHNFIFAFFPRSVYDVACSETRLVSEQALRKNVYKTFFRLNLR